MSDDSDLTHLEFSFLLYTTNLGTRSGEATNPFTKKIVQFPIDEGLSDDETEALVEYLEEQGFEGPEPHGEGYVLDRGGDTFRHRFDDEGNSASPQAELVVRKLDNDFAKIAFEIASVANCVLMSPVGKHVCVPAARYRKALLARWPDLRQLSSPKDLRSWLENDLGSRKVVRPLFSGADDDDGDDDDND
jgi:hypothetical protein